MKRDENTNSKNNISTGHPKTPRPKVPKFKKAQVTLFVILAIVIVVGAILIFTLRSDKSTNDSTNQVTSVEIEPVRGLVESCIKSSVINSVYLIGEGGGYIYPPYELSDIDGYTYYYLNGKTYFPKMEEIKERLEDNVRANILLCVNNFEDFSNMQIKEREISIKIDILDENVIFDVSYPLTIQIGEDTSYLSEFGKFNVNVRLGKIYSVVEGLMKQGAYRDNLVCLSCYMDAGFENNLTIDFLDGRNYGNVIVIKDFAMPINNETTENYYNVDLTKFEEEKVFKWIFALE